MEIDQCIDENTEDNQLERSNSTGSTEQVTESGTTEFTDVWTDFRCVFCCQDIKNLGNPKLLPCLHTACQSCLNSEVNSESSPSSSGTGKSWFKSVETVKNPNIYDKRFYLLFILIC